MFVCYPAIIALCLLQQIICVCNSKTSFIFTACNSHVCRLVKLILFSGCCYLFILYPACMHLDLLEIIHDLKFFSAHASFFAREVVSCILQCSRWSLRSVVKLFGLYNSSTNHVYFFKLQISILGALFLAHLFLKRHWNCCLFFGHLGPSSLNTFLQCVYVRDNFLR